jgi:hypothetical protein
VISPEGDIEALVAERDVDTFAKIFDRIVVRSYHHVNELFTHPTIRKLNTKDVPRSRNTLRRSSPFDYIVGEAFTTSSKIQVPDRDQKRRASNPASFLG